MKNMVSRVEPQSMENANQRVKIAIAESEQERQRIYRLRYQVYVEEMGRKLASADHKNRLVSDEFDETGFLVYAQIGSEIIGTIRNNISTPDEFSPELFQMFHMDVFRTFDNGQRKREFCFTSKYVVSTAYRRSPAAYMLVAGSYEFWRDQREVQFVFGGGNPHMIPLYERLGFRRFADNVNIPDYGCMVPLVWLVEDESHMRAVGSPFYRNARKRRNDPAAANWFVKEFPAAARFINSRLVSEDELWLILQEKLGRTPRQAIPVLEGLTEEEAKKFLHIGVVHLFKPGERFIAPGDFCHEMNILLKGRLTINNPAINNPLDTTRIKPGNFCGRVALLESGIQDVQATAVTEVELLVISGMVFEAFCSSHPKIAEKILLNLGSGGYDRCKKGCLLPVNRKA